MNNDIEKLKKILERTTHLESRRHLEFAIHRMQEEI